MDRYPLELETDAGTATGSLAVIGRIGVIVPARLPAGWTYEDTKQALLSAVVDGRAKVPDDVVTTLDLSGNAMVR